MTIKAGQRLFRLESRYQKAANRSIDGSIKSLTLAVLKINRDITQFYEGIIGKFSLDDNTDRIKPVLKNSALITTSKNRARRMARDFANNIVREMRSARKSLLSESRFRDAGAKDILKTIGVKQERGKVGKAAGKIIAEMAKDSEETIRSYFEKWMFYYPHVLRQALAANYTPEKLREALFQPNGHIRIGSSMEEAVYSAHAMDLLSQRTGRTIAEAKELNLDYCWNANPMDMRTKPECAMASTAGVIPIGDMEDNYGLPPRYICRCDLMIVNGKWTELNKGINQSIEQRRKEVVTELGAAPGKMTGWNVAGYTKADGTVVKGHRKEIDAAKDPIRAAGLEHYQETQDKLEVWIDNPVPEFNP